MSKSKVLKLVLDDIYKTIEDLYSLNMIRDCKGVSDKQMGRHTYEITYSGKNESSSVVYDKHISGEEIINSLLDDLQYTILLYDKSIVQAEYIIEQESIKKARLVFMKMHNKIWKQEEIEECEILEQDWFSGEKGIPIMLRMDCDVNAHTECEHAVAHLTLSNHESCRIPMKDIPTFSQFINFIMFHFYDKKLNISENKFDEIESITEMEKTMMHLYWM